MMPTSSNTPPVNTDAPETALIQAPETALIRAPENALADQAVLFALLDRWVERGWLRSLDRAFAAFLHREASRESAKNKENGVSEASP
ncbi:MAG: hypothetical protein WCD50_14345, partial [Onishia taeanensis]|uniref:hypothetical protein n=1 Tax=Onishia taeanensis TaxID=284577 RepID=UPI003C7D640B